MTADAAEIVRLAERLEAVEQRAVEAEYRLASYRQHRTARAAQVAAFIKARAPELWDDFAAVSVNGSLYDANFRMEPTFERELSKLRWRTEEAETRAINLLIALHDAISRPKGVVPASAEKFYDPARARAAQYDQETR